MADIVKGKIGNALMSVAPDGIVATADAIYDETKGKSQEKINEDTKQSLAEQANNIGYYECGTAAATAAKEITGGSYKLPAAAPYGGTLKVKFTYKNSAANPTLSINRSPAKPLYYNGAIASSTNTWEDGDVLDLYYDGTNFNARSVVEKFATGEKVKNVGIDYEPTAGSDNLVKSNGVRNFVTGFTIDAISNYSEYSKLMSNVYEYNGYIGANGIFYSVSTSLCKYTDIIGCITGQKFYYKGYGVLRACSVVFYNDEVAVPSKAIVIDSTNIFTEITVPEGVNKVRFISYTSNISNIPILEVYSSFYDKESSIAIKNLQESLITANDNIQQANDNISEIKKVITENNDIDLSSDLLSGFYNRGGNHNFVENSSFKTKIILASARESYIATCSLGGDSMAQICFFDNENTFLSYIQKGDSQLHTISFVVPENATSFAICSKSNYQWSLQKIGYFDFNQMSNDIEESISKSNTAILSAENAENTVNAMLERKHPQLWDGSTINAVIDTSGNLLNNESYKSTDLIKIKPNTFYYLSGRKPSIKSIRCLKADGISPLKVLVASTGEVPGSSIYYYLPTEDGSGSQYNGQFKTPSDAKYVQISLVFTNPVSYSDVILEEVGDTYNPNFVPSTDTFFDNGEAKKIKEPYVDYLENQIQDNTERIENLKNVSATPKVLLIGSSHGMNTISQLPWLFYRGEYKNVKVGNVYIGSFMIQELAQRIYNNQTLSYQEFNDDNTAGWGKNTGNKLMSQLLDMNWDVISLQRSASDDETWTLSQATSFGYVIKYISEYCKTNNLKTPRILFNSGFADANSDSGTSITHTEAILTTAKQMKKEFGIEIVPTAMALRNARTTWLNEIGAYTYHYLCYDSQHLDYGIGCWIASATLFETIMRPLGRSVATINGYGTQEEQYVFTSAATPTNYTEPTSKTMEIGKACVLSAVDDMDNLNTVITSKYQYKNSVTILSNWATISGTDADTKCVQTGGNYSIGFSVWSKATLSSVVVKMNGTDITSTAYDSSNNTISISNVDGDIEIIIITTR